MTSHRTILSILALMLILRAVMPSAALASPLLSGYGGPGEGNQAILGSALLGGTGGGGGAAGGSSGPTGSPPSDAAGVGVQAGGGASGSRGGSGEASGGAARTYSVLSKGETSQAVSGDSETLGLSGDGPLFILIALGTLAFTGVLTRRLARATRREGANSSRNAIQDPSN